MSIVLNVFVFIKALTSDNWYDQKNNAVNNERFYYCLLVKATTDDDSVPIESWLENRSR